MEICLVSYNGSEQYVEVDQEAIAHAGIVTYKGKTYMYSHSTKFETFPKFVEAIVYVAG